MSGTEDSWREKVARNSALKATVAWAILNAPLLWLNAENPFQNREYGALLLPICGSLFLMQVVLVHRVLWEQKGNLRAAVLLGGVLGLVATVLAFPLSLVIRLVLSGSSYAWSHALAFLFSPYFWVEHLFVMWPAAISGPIVGALIGSMRARSGAGELP